MAVDDPLFRLGASIPGTQYRFVEILGAGGHGTVIIVNHEFLQQRRVMKLLHAELGTDRDLVRRTIAEAQVLARMEHPNIVPVLDGGITSDGRPYFVMPELRGMTLHSMLKRLPDGLGLVRSVEVVLGILDGLDFAHSQQRVIHRDIKPPNVFLHRTATDTTVPKILDFGIAHFVTQRQRHTGRGFIGTPRYAAPEQILGENPTGRTDLYAVGLLLFECLTGRSPFSRSTDLRELVNAQVNEVPPRLKSLMDGVPTELDDLVACLLAKKQDQRPETAARTAIILRDMKERLERARRGPAVIDENRTEPTPMDTLLFTTMAHDGVEGAGLPGTRRGALKTPQQNDTVPGAPPFADVVHDTLETPIDFDTTEPAGGGVAPRSASGRDRVDRHAKTNTYKEPQRRRAPQNDTEQIDDILEGLARHDESKDLIELPRPITETPALSAAAISTRERPRARSRWQQLRAPLIAGLASSFLLLAALLIVVRVTSTRTAKQVQPTPPPPSPTLSATPVPSQSPVAAEVTPAAAASSTTVATTTSAAVTAEPATTSLPRSPQATASAPARRAVPAPPASKYGAPERALDPSSVGFE